MKPIITYALKSPPRLFLVDGIGAVISGVMLGLVWPGFDHLFGLPKTALYLLAVLPCLFATCDVWCIVRSHTTPVWVRSIATMNTLYCFLSLAVALYYWNELTVLGAAYLTGEILIVMTLAYVEYHVARGLDDLDSNKKIQRPVP